MADPSPNPAADQASPPPAPGRSQEEVALELMKFIVATTGYGKGGALGAGFSGKPGTRSPEEQSDALLELFQRCRKALKPEA
jgi:hypothetical protein